MVPGSEMVSHFHGRGGRHPVPGGRAGSHHGSRKVPHGHLCLQVRAFPVLPGPREAQAQVGGALSGLAVLEGLFSLPTGPLSSHVSLGSLSPDP